MPPQVVTTPSDRTPDPFALHPRRWRGFRYVYPVISRRAGGLSIGINLNTDKSCNFDCVYCCVDRTFPVGPEEKHPVDVDELGRELEEMLTIAINGAMWEEPRFAGVEDRYRAVRDIAFSGDGEPTASPAFDESARLAAGMRASFGLRQTQVVVITNATRLDRPNVRQTLAMLDRNGGRVWAKLDAGTEAYYHFIDRTHVPFARVLHNILDCGRERAIVVQSMFVNVHGVGPSEAEFEAYLGRLEWLLHEGCQMQSVQLYTLARPPAESAVTPLSDAALDLLAQRFRSRLPGVEMQLAYSSRGHSPEDAPPIDEPRP